MKKYTGKRDILQTVIFILLIAAIFANIKSIFSDFDVDSEYAMAMSYRMLQGDNMFSQMWEPHQTSAFLSTFLLGIYVSLIGGTTGCALFLQLSGVFIHICIVCLMYIFFKRRVDIRLAQFISIFFLLVRPKDIVFPEFSNMQIWFSVLLFLFLLLYFENGKKYWLIAASISLCLEIISYPSCLIVYILVLLLLLIYGRKRLRDTILFSVACAIQGILYIGFFTSRLGPEVFIKNIQNILAADSSHGGQGCYEGSLFFTFFLRSLIEVGLCLILTIIINLIIRKCMSGTAFILKRNPFQSSLLIFAGCYTIIDCLYVLIYRDRFSYIILFLLLVISTGLGLKYCSLEEKRITITGSIISLGSFIAVLMLTNLDFLSVVKYLILAVMVSFIPLSKILDRNFGSRNLFLKWFVLLCFCFIITFRRGVIVKTLNSMPSNLFDLGGVVKSGPLMGIVSDYMGAYTENCTLDEWDQFVKEDDCILLVGDDRINTSAYLYENVNISAASTISTPTYDEMLLDYWEQNPHKKPNLIMVQCWYGDLRIKEDSWIMQWIEEEFQPSTCSEGKYWRYYRLN